MNEKEHTVTLMLTDHDVRQYLTPAEAVAVMERVFIARANGQTAGMPRWELAFPEGRITFTVGAVPEGVGFRAYVRGQFQHDDQIVAVWDRHSGALKGIVIGEVLGVLRTGAIGGTAIKYMSPPQAAILALIGTGRQAWSQLLAIAAVRPLTEVRVYSRSSQHRASFCQNAQTLFPELNIIPVENAESAIRGAELIVGATTSRDPLIYGEWLMPGAHISTLGTKGRRIREVDEEVVNRASWIVTDSPDQTRNYPDGTILDGTDKPLHDLAKVVSGKIQRPDGDGVTLFLSAGLAGTEVALAAHLIEKYATGTVYE